MEGRGHCSSTGGTTVLTGSSVYKVARRSMKHASVVSVVGEWGTVVAVYANRGKHTKVLPPVYIGFVTPIRRKR